MPVYIKNVRSIKIKNKKINWLKSFTVKAFPKRKKGETLESYRLVKQLFSKWNVKIGKWNTVKKGIYKYRIELNDPTDTDLLVTVNATNLTDLKKWLIPKIKNDSIYKIARNPHN